MARNIELFDQMVGHIFATLYEAFPIASDVDAMPIIQKISWHDDEKAHVYFQSTYQWLISAGYVTGKPLLSSYTYTECLLTAKGLEVLKGMPKSLREDAQPLGEEISKAVKAGAADSVKGLVGQALTAGVHLAMDAAKAYFHS